MHRLVRGLALSAVLFLACANEPRDPAPREPSTPTQTDLVEPREPAHAVASAPSTAISKAAPKKELTALAGPTAEEGESRVAECKVEILARDLYAPGWLFTDGGGKAYAVEVETLKRKDGYDHRARVYDLSGARAKRVADVGARLGDAALVGSEMVLTDTDSDQLVRVPLATGKRVADGPRPQAIAARSGELVRAVVAPDGVRLSSPAGPLASLAGRWDNEVKMAFTEAHAYFYVFPHADEAGTTASVIAGRLARATIGGEAELLGSVHIAGSLAAGGGFVFAGSLGSLLRMNERTGEWQRAPNGGAENIVVDPKAAAWTESEAGTVMYWPHVAKPFLVCADLPGVNAIAMNETHVYFTAYGADLTAGGATIGRFSRPR
jgi:hypothetical protein